jgi:hypothetical protein
MSGPEPRSGYRPTFAMPVLEKAPAGDREEYYETVRSLVNLAVAPVEPRRLRIRLQARPTLYAMNGGLISYSSADGGTVILRTWGADAARIRRRLPGGMPPPLDIHYIGVPEDKARIALDVAAVWSNIDRPYLEQTWRHFHGAPPPASTTIDRLRADYLNRVIAGDRQLFVEGGTAIGEAASVGGGPEQFEFVLHWTNAGGNALSPVPYIRLMPDENYGGERWTAHPLIAAIASLPVPVDFYVKFEMWDLVDRRFVSLPAGVGVELVDDDVATTEVIGTPQTTNRDGVVHFGFARLEDLGSDMFGSGVDLFFRVRTSAIRLPFAHHTSGLPDTWSTKGFLGRHAGASIPGYYPDFRGTQIGAHDAPAVFRVGVDIHLRLRYFNSNGDHTRSGGRWEVAPLGFDNITVVRHALGVPFDSGSAAPDANGEIHMVSFGISGGNDVSFRMIFQNRANTAFNFGAMTVAQLEATGERVVYWNTDEDDEDRNNPGPTYFVENDQTSLGTQTTPLDFTVRRDDKRVAWNILKCYREWSVAMHKLTDGDWPGMTGFFLNYAPQASFSYPPGRVHIASSAHWYRPTMFHEMSHQIMWHLVNPDVIVPFLVGLVSNHGYQARHRFRLVTNARTAFFEGWAEFMSMILTGIRQPFTHVFPDADAVTASRTVALMSVPGQGKSRRGRVRERADRHLGAARRAVSVGGPRGEHERGRALPYGQRVAESPRPRQSLPRVLLAAARGDARHRSAARLDGRQDQAGPRGQLAQPGGLLPAPQHHRAAFDQHQPGHRRHDRRPIRRAPRRALRHRLARPDR